jgi:alkyl hydroperoxide reductase subunit AhpC
MTELGELERQHEEFARRNTRVVVVSVEGREAAKKTKADFPHLDVVADVRKGLTSVADAIHPGSAPDGGDTASPATLLVDRHGTVRWEYRPARFLSRLSPDELLAAIDEHLADGR